MDEIKEIRHFHLFAGLGGGAKGFNEGQARVGNLQARFRCLGGIDIDGAAVRDFSKLAGVPGTVLDLFDYDQYLSFHGHRPPKDWREATRADIHRASGNEAPHVVFLSAPCKGFSALLAESKSKSEKYQALNRLTVRGVWLMLEAFADDPPDLIVFENVPRIATRGRFLLDQIVQLLGSFGYAVAETTHDCGELGGLAQSRKRFLLVARHTEKIPPFLYEPVKRPLAAVGSVLGRMPLPGDPTGGPMHRVPSLQWKTWVRLAFVEAGSDWRSLDKLAVEEGILRDYVIMPEMHRGPTGVPPWYSPAGIDEGAVARRFGVADPRYRNNGDYGQIGVRSWNEPTGAITGQRSPIQGSFSVADPRIDGSKYNNCFRVIHFDKPCAAITAGSGPSAGGIAVADPRPPGGRLFGKYAVTPWDRRTGTVIGGDDSGAYAVADPRVGLDAAIVHGAPADENWAAGSNTDAGANQAFSVALRVADPRPNMARGRGDHYLTGGHYGVVPWGLPSGAVSASACHDNGPWSVADPRIALPPRDRKLLARIISQDGTWHRPFTTLELAALQGLIDPEEATELDGLSDSAWRERIGNAVPPPPAARAIASMMGQTLLLAWSGETFALGSTPIWVRPFAIALSVAQRATASGTKPT